MAARIEFRTLRHSRGNAAPKIIAGIAVLAAAAGAGWYFFLREKPPVIPEVAPVATEAAPGATGETAAVTPDPAALGKLNTLTVDQLFKEARTALNEQRLVSPPGNNALEFYLKILEKEPGNSGAQDALRELFTFAASTAEQEINARNIDNAQRVIDLLTKADPNNYTLTILRSKLDAQRKLVERETAQAAAAEEAARRRAEAPAAAPATPGATPAATPATADAAAATPGAAAPRTTTPATDAATPAPAPAVPVAAAPSGGDTRDAVLVKSVPPQYPNAALRRRQEGWVQVEFTVTSEGAVANARVLDADPPRTFDRAALDAVQRWTFNPALRNGSAVEATVRRRIEFKM